MRINQIARSVIQLFQPELSDSEKSIMKGMAAIERKRRAEEIARPMRELFSVLESGEVHVINDRAVMLMPELDPSVRQVESDWVEIAPALDGWIDCWRRIAPDIPSQHMQYLADRLREDKALTPRLVEKAREEFEGTIRMIPSLSNGQITDAILRTQIAWEFERREVYRMCDEASAKGLQELDLIAEVV